jgi:hypothetical protein
MSGARVRKAVFPVAGMGTRFLPVTKANPKEMLPIVDKPLIQYAAEEAIAAGITELVFVTSSAKRAIEDHFDKNYELEAELKAREKHDLLKLVRDVLPDGVSCAYVRQPEALGLGHAVLCARPIVGHEPFAVILADDLIDGGGDACLTQMTRIHAEHGCSVLGVEEVAASETDKYQRRAHRRAAVEDHEHRREARAGPDAVDARRRRPLHPDAADLRLPGKYRRRGRRRDSADRRDRNADRGRAGARLRVQRHSLRLRQQARLSGGDGRVRAQAPGGTGLVPFLSRALLRRETPALRGPRMINPPLIFLAARRGHAAARAQAEPSGR